MFMQFTYEIVIKSYASARFDFVNIVANIVTVFQIKSVKNQIRFQIRSASEAECNRVQLGA